MVLPQEGCLLEWLHVKMGHLGEEVIKWIVKKSVVNGTGGRGRQKMQDYEKGRPGSSSQLD